MSAGSRPNEKGSHMQVTINLDHAALDDLDLTVEQFEQAASAALTNLSHPESGAPIYLNNVRVIVVADCPEVACV